MSYTNDPNNPLDRVRMNIGDTDIDNEYMSDAWYIYYYTAMNQNEVLTSVEVAKKVLAKFTSNTREITDQVEVYGNETFKQYLEWLKEFIENPSLSGLRSPVPYGGGISLIDIDNNNINSDNNTLGIKTGFTADHDELTWDLDNPYYDKN
jgi:hypothetical protein